MEQSITIELSAEDVAKFEQLQQQGASLPAIVISVIEDALARAEAD